MIRHVLPYPHKLLSARCHPISLWNEHLKKLCTDLRDTCNSIDSAWGLAAIQIGSPTNVFYLHPRVTDNPEGLIFINPIMTYHGDMLQTVEEGCLSIPQEVFTMQRYASVRVVAKNERGDEFAVSAVTGLAQALQHELNHLQGKTLVDCCNPVKKKYLKEKLSLKYGGHRGKLLNFGGAEFIGK